ncbi:flagellar hook capping FlgD N-terminal domain-containing protein [Henriciella sp.]|uniref:flagellar hook assembly protein FlgD n=1 Tax=Henriciella sp. TaxID=1968823 RepID=UPI00262A9AEC|nr:flagellar hook capping FlgD N-terminal domain-containing protein [Henriciella sp.]
MSIINPAVNTQANQAASPAEATANGKAEVGEEFNQFIKLLTAQVRNQDPLSPLDSTQFVEQLATFSNLEQQVKTNTSLDGIASMIGDLHGMLASEWLGKTVSVESSWVPYSGDAVDYEVDKPAAAEKAILTIHDGNGAEVWSKELDLAAGSYSWDGRTSSGAQPAQDTLFEFGIEMYDEAGNYLGTAAPRVITEVTDVGNENGTMRVGTTSRLSADMNSVRQVQ